MRVYTRIARLNVATGGDGHDARLYRVRQCVHRVEENNGLAQYVYDAVGIIRATRDADGRDVIKLNIFFFPTPFFQTVFNAHGTRATRFTRAYFSVKA